MFYIRQISGNDEYRPISPYYGTAWYEQYGWMLYTGSLPQSRVTVEGGTTDADGITRGGTITELPAPPAPPRTFSKLKLRDKLAALGLWDALKTAIAADADVSERWALAQDVREDDSDFVALCGALSPQLATAGVSLEDALNACLMEG